MIYRFLIISDEAPNFERIIEIDSDNTFLDFQKAILKSAKYNDSELTSFFVCNEDWEKGQEILQVDMNDDSSVDTYLMEETRLSDFVEEEGQRLGFVFDMLAERALFIELKDIKYGENLEEPRCTHSKGNAPKQTSDIDELLKADIQNVGKEPMDLDSDLYGEDSFDIDDLDENSFSNIDDLQNW